VTRIVILVEGESDREAVIAVAGVLGVRLAEVSVVPIGGATNARRAALAFGVRGGGARLLGLSDRGEERHFRAALADEPDAGYEVCVEDLEDELMRALGPDRVLQVIDADGLAGRFRTFSAQPAQREWSIERRLRRFVGTTAGRKIRYGRLLAQALRPEQVPGPLVRLLDRV